MMQSMEDARSRLLELLKERSLKRGEVILSSGKRSPFYIDCRETTLHPEGAWLVGKILFEMIRASGKKVEAVGGPTLGADPMVTAISIESFQRGMPLPAFIVRKEPKGHGLKRWIEGRGNLKEGARVAMVEDVVTTGGSILKAIERAEEEGLEVVLVLALVDREEGGGERIRERGYPFHPLFNRRDLLEEG